MTLYFFDDRRLYGRSGTIRNYACPELVCEYYDGRLSTALRGAFLVRKDGKYCLLYQGFEKGTHKNIFALAESDNGYDFHYVCDIGDYSGYEIADIFRDENAPSDERFKMLLTELDMDALYVKGTVLCSSDLINWREISTDCWNDGCEPIASVFKNDVRGCYTVIRRPFWGIRLMGYTDTNDFRHFTPYETCLQADSEDGALDELYGMPVLALNDIFVGFPLIYTGNNDSHSAKFNPGNIYPQLSYSYNGHHWQRALRKSYLKEYKGQPSMFWISAFSRDSNDNHIIYVSHSSYAHGVGFGKDEGGTVYIYKTPKDRFISLDTQDGCEGAIITRENYLTGDNLTINLSADFATMAVYESKSTDSDPNPLGVTNLVEGFSHDDCIPFSGDSTDWRPVFKNHSLRELTGRTISFEIRLKSGKIFSVSGDFVPLMNTEAAKARKYGYPFK